VRHGTDRLTLGRRGYLTDCVTTPVPPVSSLRRQVDVVRRRHNLHAVQDALAIWVTAGAMAAIGIVLVAVRGGPFAFMATLACAALAGAAATALLVRRVVRRWLRAADAAGWVDSARGLGGRLPSLLELDGRAEGPFFDLLVAQGLDTRARWRPEDVVPEVVPARTFALAMTACSLLALAVALAPKLRPVPPRLLVGERRMDFIRTGGTPDAEQLLVTPGRAQQAPGSDGASTTEPEPPGALAEASEAVRSWLRDGLGVADDWEAGEEQARVDQPPAGRERAGGQPPRGARPGAAAVPEGKAGTPARDADGDAVRPAADGERGEADAGQPGSGGGGAGDGTDPFRAGDRRTHPHAPRVGHGALDDRPPRRYRPQPRAGPPPAHRAAGTPHAGVGELRADRAPDLCPRRDAA
jgi:hypothetical protein